MCWFLDGRGGGGRRRALLCCAACCGPVLAPAPPRCTHGVPRAGGEKYLVFVGALINFWKKEKGKRKKRKEGKKEKEKGKEREREKEDHSWNTKFCFRQKFQDLWFCHRFYIAENFWTKTYGKTDRTSPKNTLEPCNTCLGCGMVSVEVQSHELHAQGPFRSLEVAVMSNTQFSTSHQVMALLLVASCHWFGSNDHM